jgi:hypothetical protein
LGRAFYRAALIFLSCRSRGVQSACDAADQRERLAVAPNCAKIASIAEFFATRALITQLGSLLMKTVVYASAVAAVLFASCAPAATLKLTDKLTAYHAASPAERKAVVPLALAEVNDEIDRKGKTDAEIGAEILPCMDSVDEQVSDADRATQPVLDLAAVCLAQLGYKK